MMMKWAPLKDVLTFQDEVNSLFDLPAPENAYIDRDWVPAVDVLETSEAIEIRAEIPGMDLKDVGIDLDGDLLTLKGEKKADTDRKGKFQQVESVYGRFVRSFRLPTSVDRDRIRATYNQGVLKLELPKREETKPRTISIETN